MRNSTQNRLSLVLARGMELFVYLMVRLAILQIISAIATAAMVMWCSLTVSTGNRNVVMGDGPVPAAQTSANMPQARLTVYYNAKFMQWLYKNFNKLMLCKMKPLPEKSGASMRNFMSNTLPPDLVQQTEGYPGSPEQISVNFRDINLGQWANYTNLSDYAYMTSISEDLVEYQRILAYQLGWTMDDIIMMFMDYLRTLDSRTSNQDSLQAPYYFGKNIIEQMPASLAGADVPPMEGGFYNGSIHNFFIGDLMLDNSNNSLVDVWKHTEAGQMRLIELQDADEGQGQVRIMEIAGCHWRPSNNQTMTANWQGSGQTGISTYLAGYEAMLAIEFPNTGRTKLSPKWQNLNVWQGKYAERTAFDPNNVVYGGAGYNCLAGFGPPPDINSRMRIAIAVAQTS